MFPSGLNFTQVNPLIQQPEKRVKSTDLQALRVLWERSNCPRLNSSSARHLLPSCLLLLTPCIPPSFSPRSENLGWQERKNKSPLNSKYFWDWSSLHLWGQRRTKACTWAGAGEWGIKPPAKASSSFISWHGSADKISCQMGTGPDFPASQVGVTLYLKKEALPHPGFSVLPTSTSPKCPENSSWLRTPLSEEMCVSSPGLQINRSELWCKWLKTWGSSPETELWISEHWVLERFDIRSSKDCVGPSFPALCQNCFFLSGKNCFIAFVIFGYCSLPKMTATIAFTHCGGRCCIKPPAWDRFCSPFPKGSCEMYGCCAGEEWLNAKISLIQSLQVKELRHWFQSSSGIRNNYFVEIFTAPIQMPEFSFLLQSWDRVLVWGHLLWTHFSMGSLDLVRKGDLLWFSICIYFRNSYS